MISNDLNIPIDLIQNCLDEIEPDKSKEDLLYDLTKERLDKYNKDYIDNFNQTVDRLYDCAVEGNINGVCSLIKKLSGLLNNFYKVELKVYKALGAGCHDK